MTFTFNKAVLKRFIKGLLAAIVAAGLTYAISFLTKNPLALGAFTPLLTAGLLAVEKSVPNNM